MAEPEFCPQCGWPGACRTPSMCMAHCMENLRARNDLEPTNAEMGKHAQGANYIFAVAAAQGKPRQRVR